MNEDLEAINESVSLGNAGDAVANLAPNDTGVALALGWTVHVGGLNLSHSGTNRVGDQFANARLPAAVVTSKRKHEISRSFN